MDNSIRVPIDLPDIQVLELSKTEQGDWLIKVESTLQGAICHKCGREITEFHGHDLPVRLRHLPLFEVPVYIEFRPKRYRCRHCDNNPTTTQRVQWHEARSPNTKPYERWLLRILVNSTVTDVARKLEVSEDIVNGAVERWLPPEVDWEEFLELKVIGIDEISLYFLEGWTSGFVEGFNNKIKVLKRRCYGIFDVKNLFRRISLDLHGHEKFAFP
jgi:transposase